MMFYRYTYCGGSGGLVIADSMKSATGKLEKKFGEEAASSAKIWPWEYDDYYDSENPDVLDVYDA